MELPEIQTISAQDAVARALRRWIALGLLRPGDQLPPERELSERLGIGRRTLREAIRVLNDEGLVRTVKGRSGGTFVDESRRGVAVRDLSQQLLGDIEDNFSFRMAIEPLAARLCAQRAGDEERWAIRGLCETTASSMRGWRSLDSRFHLLIAEASGHELVIESVRTSRTEFFLWADELFSGVEWMHTPAWQRDFGGQHRPIAAAIQAGDAEESERRMAEHLRIGRQQFVDAVREIVADRAGAALPRR